MREKNCTCEKTNYLGKTDANGELSFKLFDDGCFPMCLAHKQ